MWLWASRSRVRIKQHVHNTRPSKTAFLYTTFRSRFDLVGRLRVTSWRRSLFFDSNTRDMLENVRRGEHILSTDAWRPGDDFLSVCRLKNDAFERQRCYYVIYSAPIFSILPTGIGVGELTAGYSRCRTFPPKPDETCTDSVMGFRHVERQKRSANRTTVKITGDEIFQQFKQSSWPTHARFERNANDRLGVAVRSALENTLHESEIISSEKNPIPCWRPFIITGYRIRRADTVAGSRSGTKDDATFQATGTTFDQTIIKTRAVGSAESVKLNLKRCRAARDGRCWVRPFQL